MHVAFLLRDLKYYPALLNPGWAWKNQVPDEYPGLANQVYDIFRINIRVVS